MLLNRSTTRWVVVTGQKTVHFVPSARAACAQARPALPPLEQMRWVWAGPSGEMDLWARWPIPLVVLMLSEEGWGKVGGSAEREG